MNTHCEIKVGEEMERGGEGPLAAIPKCTKNHKLKAIHPELSTLILHPEPEIRDRNPESRNPKVRTRNQKPETRNPTPENHTPKTKTFEFSTLDPKL